MKTSSRIPFSARSKSHSTVDTLHVARYLFHSYRNTLINVTNATKRNQLHNLVFEKRQPRLRNFTCDINLLLQTRDLDKRN